MKADVGLEQRFLDELEPVAHVRFGELALPAERFERGTKAILQSFEHEEGVSGRRSVVRDSRKKSWERSLDFTGQTPFGRGKDRDALGTMY